MTIYYVPSRRTRRYLRNFTKFYFQEKIGDITQLLWGSGLEYRVYSKVEKILYNTVEELYPEVVDYRQEFIK